MMLDLTFMFDMINMLTLVACLIVGYLWKLFVPKDNKWIPTILVVFGAVICCIANTTITLEVVVSGALTGLISTGLHQAFTQLINNTKAKVLTAEMEDELNRFYIDDDREDADKNNL